MGLRRGRDGPGLVRDRGVQPSRRGDAAAGVPVARIVPGEGVELESGDTFQAVVGLERRPEAHLDMLDPDAVPSEYRERLER